MPRRNDAHSARSGGVPTYVDWIVVLGGLGLLSWFGSAQTQREAKPGAEEAPFAQVQRDDLEAPVWSLVFAPDDTRLAFTTMAGDLWIKRLDSGESVRIGRASQEMLRSIAFSPDGKTLAAAGNEPMIRLWNVEKRYEQDPLTLGTEPIKLIAFSPDGTRLAVAHWSTDNGTSPVAVWDRIRGERLNLPGGRRARAVNGLAFSPDGTRLAAGGSDGVVSVWDSNTGEVRMRSEANGQWGDGVVALAFSADGSVLATAHFPTGAVRLWDVLRGQLRSTLPTARLRVYGLAFSPDGMTLAVALEGGVVTLWDSAPLRKRAALRANGSAFEAVAFSHDGRFLATGGKDGTVRLWDVARALSEAPPARR